MKYWCVICLLLPFPVLAEIYKWTDESGTVHFGDSPRAEDRAEKISVEVNTYEHVSFETLEGSQVADTKQVIMYSASWCGYCKKARKYFQANNIAFTEYDIEKNASARKNYDALGGRGVPVILVGKKRMNGFSAAGFERIYN